MQEVVAMLIVWIAVALLVLFLVWAGWRLRGRTQASGPDLRVERDRRTGPYEQGNS